MLLKISSPAFVVEGQSYPVRLTVTNQSTRAGIPTEAMLRIAIEALVSLDAWVTETLIPAQEREEYFSANQTRTFDYTMNIPLGLGGYSGYIGASVKDPTGLITLDSASEPLVVEAAPEVGQWVSPTGDDGAWAGSGHWAYDGDLTTSATRTGAMKHREMKFFLEFSIEPIMSSGIRFYSLIDAWGKCIVDIDIKSNGTWHHIYDSLFYEMPSLIWNIVSFAPQLVTGARIRVSAQPVSFDLLDQLRRFELFEFEFWQGTGFPGVEPGAGFAYASNVRYSSMLIDRIDAQVFEVDVINLGTEPRECVLECFIQIQPVSDEGVPGSRRDWVPDTAWDGEIEPYRVKRAMIQPAQVVTFRGISNYHFFGEYDHRLWAKFVGEPGEIVSSMIKVEPYA